MSNKNEILEILPISAQRRYNSLYIKSGNINSKIEAIRSLNDSIIDNLPIISNENSSCLLNYIYEVSEYIYSCTEYIGQIIRDICRVEFREELSDGFNKMLSGVEKYKNGVRKSEVYSDSVIRNYIDSGRVWYDIIHDIRTEETHYGSGIIEVDISNSKWLLYKNLCRNGKGNKKEINISLENIVNIYNQFDLYVKQLDDVIKYIYNR